MNWIFYALLGPVFLTVNNFTDKYLIGNAVKDYRGLVILQAIMGFLVGTIFWIVTGFPVLSVFDASIVLLTGSISTWGAALYFKALSEEETSYVIFLYQLIPIFTIILSFIFLHETISLQQFIGFSLVLISSLFISTKKGKHFFHVSKTLWLLILMDFMFAGSAILIKFAIKITSFSQILSYESWGIGLGGIILYLAIPSIRQGFHGILKSAQKKIIGVMFLNELIYVVSKSLTYFAYSIGPVALVSVLGSTQIFMGILVGWVLTILYPHIFAEKIAQKDLVKKLVFSVILIIGIVLIY